MVLLWYAPATICQMLTEAGLQSLTSDYQSTCLHSVK
jgi:hypothetical protein